MVKEAAVTYENMTVLVMIRLSTVIHVRPNRTESELEPIATRTELKTDTKYAELEPNETNEPEEHEPNVNSGLWFLSGSANL